MNKLELIKSLRNECQISKKEAAAVVDLFFNEMANALAKGDRVEIRGLCSFYVKKYKAYAGRNPKTGETVEIAPKEIAVFQMWDGIEEPGGSINLCKEKYMEEGKKKCPKCDGNGKQEYVYFQIGAILENLASLKKGKTIDNLTSSARQIRIICPFCEGTGKVDWVAWAMRKSYSKPFSKLEGCLDILLDELRVHLWYSNPPDRNGIELIDDISEYSNPENIIKFSQKRYDGPIKLNNDFLSMTADELKKIEGILNWYDLEIPEPNNEEQIGDYLKQNGLSKYKPDKFAYPDPDDFDEQFY